MLADNAFERPQKRRDQQAHHAAIQLVSDAGVIAFAEIKAQAGVRHRVS